MTDADRLLRQIERQQAEKQAEAVARDQEQAIAALAGMIQDVAAEAAAVLFLLHQQEFPQMIGATVQRPRFGLKGLFGYTTERVAAWELSRYSRPGERKGEILLLSNAKFMLSDVVGAGQELDVDDDLLLARLPTILDALQNFRETLERQGPLLDADL